MDIDAAIRVAESLLPGVGALVHETDPRWKALLGVRRHVGEEPGAVWDFVKRWGIAREPTLRHAVAVCLLQELLALHFLEYYPEVERRVREEHVFADTFRRCAKQGQAALPMQAQAFDELVRFAEAWSGADLSETRFRGRASVPGRE
ncbi:MAG: hypothetical protein IPJ19_02935 [Planctomycetes bacterium]|nr:hypothetical protein [Planctomycetota bacterium]